ncbi:MAG: AzlC family ABC transporter permease [Firmicutes bacterium]|nr:AzlC family ABC transporter permease [Bacillota bacterium]
MAFFCDAEGKKWLAAFGLTDEVFAVTGAHLANKRLSPHYPIPFEGFCYASWVLGTLLGAIIGHAVPAQLSDILTFALPALFLALLLMGKRSFAALSAAACGATIAVLATALQWGNFGIVLGAVGGATLGFVLQRWLHPLTA